MATVDLLPAYAWRCTCGRMNFEIAAIHEPTAAQRAKSDANDTGQWITCPDKVACRRCGDTYDAKHFLEP